MVISLGIIFFSWCVISFVLVLMISLSIFQVLFFFELYPTGCVFLSTFVGNILLHMRLAFIQLFYCPLLQWWLFIKQRSELCSLARKSGPDVQSVIFLSATYEERRCSSGFAVFHPQSVCHVPSFSKIAFSSPFFEVPLLLSVDVLCTCHLSLLISFEWNG